jgi:hypothetical protein
VLRRDANAVVAHVEPRLAFVIHAHLDGDVTAGWRVPDGVLDQVGHQLA